jgi:hypothetical protein
MWKSDERLKNNCRGSFFMKIPRGLPGNEILSFWCFSFVPLVELNRLVCYLWKSVERLKSYFWGIFSWKSPDVPLGRNCEVFDVSISSPCAAESIDILHEKIGWTVNRLLLRVVFSWKFPGAPLKWNSEFFDVLAQFRLLSWIDWYTTCENRLNG